MRRRAWIWAVPSILYLAFFVWYTDLGGALEPDEIEAFVALLEQGELGPERVAGLRRFMEADTGRQFLMQNAIDFADDPPDVEGAAPGETAEQLMGRYMEHMYAQLLRRACHPVVYGDAIFRSMDIVGVEGAEEWTNGALVRYRSRRSFIEIVANPDMLERHGFKVAALEKTIAFPIETRLYLGDPRVLLGLLLLSGASLLDLAIGRRDGAPS